MARVIDSAKTSAPGTHSVARIDGVSALQHSQRMRNRIRDRIRDRIRWIRSRNNRAFWISGMPQSHPNILHTKRFGTPAVDETEEVPN